LNVAVKRFLEGIVMAEGECCRNEDRRQREGRGGKNRKEQERAGIAVAALLVS
jgi:hypothetical protein